MSNNPQQWHVFLCDDEPLVLDRLRELCEKTLLPQFSTVFHCAAGPDALPDRMPCRTRRFRSTLRCWTSN